ncbi:MAG: PAS domain-containing protein [Verrucomicrobia bacterium]|nr:PAS domain-containing protein [Verrucomicrobiota bacterium]
MKASKSNAKRKVLLIEDNPGDARLMREYLADPAGAQFELEHVTSLTDGLARLTQGGVDLVLLDLSLPDSPMAETFKRAHAAAPQVPIIVMSGLDDEKHAIETVQEGAQDYLVKAFVDTRLLVHAMRYAIERKRAEEALAHERDLLHTLLDNLPDRIYFKDDQSRFTRISKAVTEQFKIGHPREAMGKTDRDFFSAEHAEIAMRDEAQVMETGQPILAKVEREILPDGSVTWALTSKLPLKNRQGKTIGNFGISRDITEIKRIEEHLDAERNLLRSLIDNLPDYIYVKDTEGRYLLDNIAHRRWLGADSESQVVGRRVSDFFPAEAVDRFTNDDLRVIQSGFALLNREELVEDRLGNKRWHATTKVPIRSKDGKVTGLVGISRDITERKLSVEAIREANAELARNKDELQRTLTELQQSHEEVKSAQFQLIQAEKMQSIGRLAAGVAHEVKNPLGILRMGTDYLAQNLKSSDENVALILSDMMDAIKRADGIIMGLLDFSVPHALDTRAEDLSAVLEQSIGFVRHDLNEAGLKLVRELAGDLPPVWIDRNKMKQVFVNILMNAIHATPAGGTLTVRTSCRVLGAVEHDAGSREADRIRAGETVVIAEVIDTGSGIPEEKLRHIFDPFFTTKETGKGTGLGLSVTKKIVELHGGSLDIRNRKEGGVAATIMFKV